MHAELARAIDEFANPARASAERRGAPPGPRLCSGSSPGCASPASPPCRRDRVFDGGRRAVVEQRTTEAQAPQRRCANLLGRAGCLLNAVAGPDVVQQQIGEERHGDTIEERVRARPGRQHRRVTGAAADGAEDALAVPAPPRQSAREPSGARNFMKLAKLSMPRRPVRGSLMSSGSGYGSHTRMRSCEIADRDLLWRRDRW